MCHSYRLQERRAERPEPLVAEPLDVRASDAERERVVAALRAHAGAGRLTVEELEARIGRAYAAATRADLRPLLADLPAILGRRPRPRAHDAHAWQVWASVAIVLLVVWAATGAGAFWPVWPLGFWALGLMLGHGAPRHHWERPRV
jgi:Domain of unknown function (DUF1707)